MLDGAVARLGGSGTRLGAFLDSTTDRFSDFAVYAGIALHYAARSPANLTFVLAAMWAFFSAFMISYTRARAEDLIDRCRVGYWQRGERSAAILIGTFSYHVPALLAQQALLPMFSALRRITYTARAVAGRAPAEHPSSGPWWVRIQPWRYPRMSAPYDAITAANIAWLVLADLPQADPLRSALGG
jgi:CDP-diacylglycerol--glycerol-3-phosphate 3-phosphatidyltransferase